MKSLFFANGLWQAYQLGLYRTIIQQKIYLPTKQTIIIKKLALLKRFEMDNADKVIIDLLNANQNNKWFRIIIKSLAPIYPNIIFDYLNNHHCDFKNDEVLYGIDLALSLKYNKNRDNAYQKLDKINPQERLLFLNNITDNHQEKLALFNDYLTSFQLTTLNNIKKFTLKHFNFDVENKINHDKKVSILVTTYNSSATIEFCLKSLLSQSWQNLQIIVIDDNSSDETVNIVKSIKDDRLMIISLPKNTGTFVAKSIGAIYATGEFLTCQDSDDFAHPDKIKEQVLPLINDPALIATNSYWLRVDDKGDFYVRQHYPFLRQNPASPLFRREKVQNDIGLWHLVRTGADSEFFERLKLVYGHAGILSIRKPLTFASHREDSLMNNNEYGMSNASSAEDRLDYWENWRLWHLKYKKDSAIYMPPITQQLMWPVIPTPEKLVVVGEDVRYNINNAVII